jgi:DNA mismatch repair ATPase MutL
MKRILFVLLVSFLALAACGNSEESKSDDKKETKSSNEKNKKDNKKSNDDKKSDKEKEESNDNSDDTDNVKVADNEQSEQTTSENKSQNKALTKEEISQQMKNGVNVNGMVDADGDTWYQAPGNGDVVGYTKPDGTQCTVGGCVTPAQQERMDAEQDNEEQYDETDDVNAEINSAETEDEQVEALRKKYNGDLSSGELQTKTAIEQGYYDGDDADEVYNKIEEREADIESGKYDHYKN